MTPPAELVDAIEAGLAELGWPDDPLRRLYAAAVARRVCLERLSPLEAVAEQLERDDPWRWWCRHCGAGGAREDEMARDFDAADHVRAAHAKPWSQQIVMASSGRLAHVWPLPADTTPPDGAYAWPWSAMDL